MASRSTSEIHVMVAILRDAQDRVLISQRPAGKTQAGRWEFPGGKVEPNESPEAALRRELLEELGIVAGPMRHLIHVRHAYPDFSVLLDVREIRHFGGHPRSLENQALRWVESDALPGEDILEADQPIIQAARLPEHCLITPDPATYTRRVFLAELSASLAAGIRLVQLRARSLAVREYISLAAEVLPLCHQSGAKLMLNGDPDLLRYVDADGIHLDSRRMRLANARPVAIDKWFSTACHSIHELDLATRLQADFVIASPVQATPTHPDALPLGWAAFERLTERATLPVYALGGMRKTDSERARSLGGQGVAGISGFWQSSATRC